MVAKDFNGIGISKQMKFILQVIIYYCNELIFFYPLFARTPDAVCFQ